MKAHNILLFFVSVIIILAAICLVFPDKGIPIGFANLQFPDVREVLVHEKKSTVSAEDRIKEMEESLRIKHVQDSISAVEQKLVMQQDSAARADSLAYIDSLKFYRNFFENHASRLHLPKKDPDYLKNFFAKLKKNRNKRSIHILHYGDSQIEGDRITGYIRSKFQKNYGGRGAGLVPAIQPIPSLSIEQSYSGNIERFIVDGNHAQKADHKRYGAMAQVSVLNGDAVINLSARSSDKKNKFSVVRVFVGNVQKDLTATLFYGDTSAVQEVYAPYDDLSVLTFETGTDNKSVKLKLSGSAEIYGISLEDGAGVYVDNLPLRGSSGTFFTKMDRKNLKQMYDELNVDLVIMEFGGNVMPYIKSERNVEVYRSTMSYQIQFIKSICPNAKIIFIGPADMSTKVDGELRTYDWLEANIEGLKSAALENGVAFWNMYEVMGGYNSMINWVSNRPQLAASDYVHFTPKGANRIAEIFYESIKIYSDYYDFSSKKHKWKR